MFEYSADHFSDLCRNSVVREQISHLDENRGGAVRRFWMLLIGGILLAIAVAVVLWDDDNPTWSILALVAILIVAAILAYLPLSKAGQSLKHPVLKEIAKQGGMEYVAAGFEPPIYPEARNTLFGTWLTTQIFTDLFQGTDQNGQRFALYEATLTRKSGKSSETVFTGQVYAFQRRSRGGGTIAIVPDRGLFNFFKPAKGMERVKFEGDPDFEKKFEVYATHGSEALGLIGSDVRRLLLELRQGGRVFAYVGPEDMLIAAWGKNRFEAGSILRSVGGQERVKTMFDEVCESLGVMRKVKRAFD